MTRKNETKCQNGEFTSKLHFQRYAKVSRTFHKISMKIETYRVDHSNWPVDLIIAILILLDAIKLINRTTVIPYIYIHRDPAIFAPVVFVFAIFGVPNHGHPSQFSV